MAMSYATLKFRSEECVVIIHAPPPVPIDASGMRPYIEHLSERIKGGRAAENWGACKAGDRLVLTGDFNAVAGSWPLRQLLAQGFEDRLWMRGIWSHTWPMNGHFFPIPVFRIDHLLAHPELDPHIELLSVPDSDHRALKLTF